MSWIGQLSRGAVQVALVVVALLVALRVALPQLVQKYVNKKLDEMPEYDGRIGDVDMHLWRGAYSIQSIEIVKTAGDVPVPFFKSNRVTFSVEWNALLNGALVGEVDFFEPVMNFVRGRSRKTTQVGVDKPWLDVVKELFPLNINRFQVHNGTVHYRDFQSRPRVDLKIDQIGMLDTNLTNSRKLSKSLVADIKLTGRAFESAPLDLSVKLDPSTKRATFDLAAKMKTIPLTNLNDFAEAYGNFSFEKGTLAITAELAAENGKLTGYIKPLLDDIAIIDLSETKTNPLKVVWESVVAGVSRVFRNQPKNRFATKLPVSGTMDDPKADVLSTLGNILKTNSFEPLPASSRVTSSLPTRSPNGSGRIKHSLLPCYLPDAAVLISIMAPSLRKPRFSPISPSLKGRKRISSSKERVPLLLDQLFEIEREISANEAAQQKERILGLVASMLGEFAAFICQPYR